MVIVLRILPTFSILPNARHRNMTKSPWTSLPPKLDVTSLKSNSQFFSRFHRQTRLKVTSQVENDIDFDLQGDRVAEDYYSILGLTPFASQGEIKKAYYNCMKVCHPDLSGNHPDSVAFCQFINEVYEVLSDAELRAVYDEINGYSASGTNPFYDTTTQRDHVFVDEFSCIGCKNCANTAECTFEIELDFGRARVMNQLGDSPALIQEAIDTCPVNCIHWTTAAQLSLLEDEMRRVERVAVGIMLAGQGYKGADVFAQAVRRWEKRQRKAQELAKARMMKEKGRKYNQWGMFWQSNDDEEAEEAPTEAKSSRKYDAKKMSQVAAAARRWREYSRRGVDRRATRVIAAASELREEESPV